MIEPNHERIRELAEEYTNANVPKRHPMWWKVFNAYKRGCYTTIKILNEEKNARPKKGEIKP